VLDENSTAACPHVTGNLHSEDLHDTCYRKLVEARHAASM